MKLVITSVLAIVLLALTTLALADNPFERTRLYYRGPFTEGDQDEESVISFKPLQADRDPSGASLLKNRVRGPSDIGIYYINKASVSCGGLTSSQCSTSCGKLGYPVYWCYPHQCYCHYGTTPGENEFDAPLL